MATSADTFQKVLSVFTAGLLKDETEDFRFSKLEDVHRVIEEI